MMEMEDEESKVERGIPQQTQQQQPQQQQATISPAASSSDGVSPSLTHSSPASSSNNMGSDGPQNSSVGSPSNGDRGEMHSKGETRYQAAHSVWQENWFYNHTSSILVDLRKIIRFDSSSEVQDLLKRKEIPPALKDDPALIELWKVLRLRIHVLGLKVKNFDLNTEKEDDGGILETTEVSNQRFFALCSKSDLAQRSRSDNDKVMKKYPPTSLYCVLFDQIHRFIQTCDKLPEKRIPKNPSDVRKQLISELTSSEYRDFYMGLVLTQQTAGSEEYEDWVVEASKCDWAHPVFLYAAAQFYGLCVHVVMSTGTQDIVHVYPLNVKEIIGEIYVAKVHEYVYLSLEKEIDFMNRNEDDLASLTLDDFREFFTRNKEECQSNVAELNKSIATLSNSKTILGPHRGYDRINTTAEQKLIALCEVQKGVLDTELELKRIICEVYNLGAQQQDQHTICAIMWWALTCERFAERYFDIGNNYTSMALSLHSMLLKKFLAEWACKNMSTIEELFGDPSFQEDPYYVALSANDPDFFKRLWNNLQYIPEGLDTGEEEEDTAAPVETVNEPTGLRRLFRRKRKETNVSHRPESFIEELWVNWNLYTKACLAQLESFNGNYSDLYTLQDILQYLNIAIEMGAELKGHKDVMPSLVNIWQLKATLVLQFVEGSHSEEGVLALVEECLLQTHYLRAQLKFKNRTVRKLFLCALDLLSITEKDLDSLTKLRASSKKKRKRGYMLSEEDKRKMRAFDYLSHLHTQFLILRKKTNPNEEQAQGDNVENDKSLEAKVTEILQKKHEIEEIKNRPLSSKLHSMFTHDKKTIKSSEYNLLLCESYIKKANTAINGVTENLKQRVANSALTVEHILVRYKEAKKHLDRALDDAKYIQSWSDRVAIQEDAWAMIVRVSSVLIEFETTNDSALDILLQTLEKMPKDIKDQGKRGYALLQKIFQDRIHKEEKKTSRDDHDKNAIHDYRRYSLGEIEPSETDIGEDSAMMQQEVLNESTGPWKYYERYHAWRLTLLLREKFITNLDDKSCEKISKEFSRQESIKWIARHQFTSVTEEELAECITRIKTMPHAQLPHFLDTITNAFLQFKSGQDLYHEPLYRRHALSLTSDRSMFARRSALVEPLSSRTFRESRVLSMSSESSDEITNLDFAAFIAAMRSIHAFVFTIGDKTHVLLTKHSAPILHRIFTEIVSRFPQGRTDINNEVDEGEVTYRDTTSDNEVPAAEQPTILSSKFQILSQGSPRVPVQGLCKEMFDLFARDLYELKADIRQFRTLVDEGLQCAVSNNDLFPSADTSEEIRLRLHKMFPFIVENCYSIGMLFKGHDIRRAQEYLFEGLELSTFDMDHIPQLEEGSSPAPIDLVMKIWNEFNEMLENNMDPHTRVEYLYSLLGRYRERKTVASEKIAASITNVICLLYVKILIMSQSFTLTSWMKQHNVLIKLALELYKLSSSESEKGLRVNYLKVVMDTLKSCLTSLREAGLHSGPEYKKCWLQLVDVAFDAANFESKRKEYDSALEILKDLIDPLVLPTTINKYENSRYFETQFKSIIKRALKVFEDNPATAVQGNDAPITSSPAFVWLENDYRRFSKLESVFKKHEDNLHPDPANRMAWESFLTRFAHIGFMLSKLAHMLKVDDQNKKAKNVSLQAVDIYRATTAKEDKCIEQWQKTKIYFTKQTNTNPIKHFGNQRSEFESLVLDTMNRNFPREVKQMEEERKKKKRRDNIFDATNKAFKGGMQAIRSWRPTLRYPVLALVYPFYLLWWLFWMLNKIFTLQVVGIITSIISAILFIPTYARWRLRPVRKGDTFLKILLRDYKMEQKKVGILATIRAGVYSTISWLYVGMCAALGYVAVYHRDSAFFVFISGRDYQGWYFWTPQAVEVLLVVLAIATLSWPSAPPKVKKYYSSRIKSLKETCLIIACHASEDMIRETLEHALGLEWEVPFYLPEQIFIAHNGNQDFPVDDTRHVAEQVSREFNEKMGRPHIPENSVQYTWIPIGNKSYCFYFVAKYIVPSKYKYCMLIDDDVHLPQDMFIPTVEFKLDPKVKALAFTLRVSNIYTKKSKSFRTINWAGAFQDMEYKKAGLLKLFQSKMGSTFFAHGAVALWDKETLVNVLRLHKQFHGDDVQMGCILHKFNRDYRMKVVGNVPVGTIVPDHFVCLQAFWCRHGLKSLLIQRVRSWDAASHRLLWDYLKILVFYWKRNVLVLKPFILYEMWAIIMDWLRFPLLIILLSNTPLSFLIYFVAIWLVQLAVLFPFNYWTLRDRPDLQSHFLVPLLYPLYGNFLLILRLLGFFYAIFYWIPKTTNTPMIKEWELYDHSLLREINSEGKFIDRIPDEVFDFQIPTDMKKVSFKPNGELEDINEGEQGKQLTHEQLLELERRLTDVMMKGGGGGSSINNNNNNNNINSSSNRDMAGMWGYYMPPMMYGGGGGGGMYGGMMYGQNLQQQPSVGVAASNATFNHHREMPAWMYEDYDDDNADDAGTDNNNNNNNAQSAGVSSKTTNPRATRPLSRASSSSSNNNNNNNSDSYDQYIYHRHARRDPNAPREKVFLALYRDATERRRRQIELEKKKRLAEGGDFKPEPIRKREVYGYKFRD